MNTTLTIAFIVFVFTLVFMTARSAGTGVVTPFKNLKLREKEKPDLKSQFDSRGLAFESVRGRVPFDPSRGSKCFSCEAQDAAMGISRDYGSKCIDCEVQDRSMGIYRGYGSKWY